MAITCYKNYGTPPNSTGVPATRTRYALATSKCACSNRHNRAAIQLQLMRSLTTEAL